MTKLRGWMLGTLFVAGTALGTRGCGGVTDDRASARERATKSTCDRYNTCGLIGMDAGDAYPNYANCEITWRANWESAWPAADCQGRIRGADLDVCLAAISATDCASVIDFLTTLGKCGKAMICSAGTQPDGG
jgi:hypothetical protein